MKRIGLIIAPLLLLPVACYEPYSTSIQTDNQIMVVEGLITNETATYHIKLSYAIPFYSSEAKTPVSNARVYVTDEKDNDYTFRELEEGHYVSDSLKFTGQPGSIYTLTISAPDGNIYRSDPQLLPPIFCPENVSAEPGIRETLSQFTGQISLSEGAVLVADIKGQEGAIPEFRFSSELVRQYFYTLELPPPPPPWDPTLFAFYCWQTDNYDSSINLTKMGYSLDTLIVNEHEFCFVEDQIYLEAKTYLPGQQQPDLSFPAVPAGLQQYTVSQRIVYLSLFTLNNDAYLYYKGMDDQMRAEGKLFDPIAVQLVGNISCVTFHDKKVLGFFEVSSVSRTGYLIGVWNPVNKTYPIKKIPYLLPPEPDGCRIDKAPLFWIY